MYKVHIENKKQVVRSIQSIKQGEVISVVIENGIVLPKLTFLGKLLTHSDESNCELVWKKYNTYYLVSKQNIEENDILTINVNDGPWYLKNNIDV